jgi:hypothetical protein
MQDGLFGRLHDEDHRADDPSDNQRGWLPGRSLLPVEWASVDSGLRE